MAVDLGVRSDVRLSRKRSNRNIRFNFFKRLWVKIRIGDHNWKGYFVTEIYLEYLGGGFIHIYIYIYPIFCLQSSRCHDFQALIGTISERPSHPSWRSQSLPAASWDGWRWCKKTSALGLILGEILLLMLETSGKQHLRLVVYLTIYNGIFS